MNIAIPPNNLVFYNFDEFIMWIIIKDFITKHSEVIVDNPHVDKNGPDKIQRNHIS
jgi:hypothetical protein